MKTMQENRCPHLEAAKEAPFTKQTRQFLQESFKLKKENRHFMRWVEQNKARVKQIVDETENQQEKSEAVERQLVARRQTTEESEVLHDDFLARSVSMSEDEKITELISRFKKQRESQRHQARYAEEDDY